MVIKSETIVTMLSNQVLSNQVLSNQVLSNQVLSNQVLSNQVSGVPLARRRPAAGLARVLTLLIMLMDVFAEAQDMARAAHQRYPFAEW